MVDESLGSEFSKSKIYYFLFLMGIYLVYFFLYIGMQNDTAYAIQADKLWFYMWFGVVLGLIPFIIDLFINQNKDLPLDTISYEENSWFEPLNNIWVQLGASLVLSLIIWFRIQLTGQAFVKAPSFALTIPVISALGLSDKFIGAFISGITAGIVESIVFFGFVLPTVYAYLKEQGTDGIVAMIIAVLVTSVIFTGYHWWVYGYIITALIAVFIFGILQGVFVVIFRSMIPLFFTHFVNNFAVNMFVLSAYVVQVIL